MGCIIFRYSLSRGNNFSGYSTVHVLVESETCSAIPLEAAGTLQVFLLIQLFRCISLALAVLPLDILSAGAVLFIRAAVLTSEQQLRIVSLYSVLTLS